MLLFNGSFFFFSFLLCFSPIGPGIFQMVLNHMVYYLQVTVPVQV